MAILVCVAGLARQASAAAYISDYSTINASGVNNVYGIHAWATSTTSKDIIVGNNVSVNISSTGSNGSDLSSAGLYATGAGASINAGSSLTVSATGNYLYGIHAAYGGDINIGSSADITTSGISAYGAYANNNSSTNIGGGATIKTSGLGAYGASASNNSAMVIGQGATITTSSNYAIGAYASNSTMVIGEGATINTTGINAYGADAIANATMSIGEGATITTTGTGAYGAVASNNSTMDLGAGATITTSGSGAYGAVASDSTMIISEDATITTTGQGAHAVYSYGMGASSVALNGGTISATGTGAYAIMADGNAQITGGGVFDITGNVGNDGNGLVELTMSDDSTITGNLVNVKGSGALNINMVGNSSVTGTAKSDGTTGSNVINIAGGAITAASGNNTLEVANSGTINLTGTTANADGANLIYSATSGTVSATDSILRGDTINEGEGEMVVNLTDSSEIGDARSDGNGTLTVNMVDSSITGNLINVSGDGALNVNMVGDSGVIGTAMADGATRVINIDGGAITAAAGNNTLEVENGGTINLTGTTANANGGELIATASSGSVLASAATLTGGISNTGIGVLDVTLDSGSVLTGAVLTNAAGAANLNMADSRWNVTGDSNLTRLDLDSTVVDYSGAAAWTTVTADTLDGAGGTFLMKADVVNSIGDKLEITNTMNGSQHYITVLNSGSAATKGNEIVDLVDTADATGNFQLTNAVELGAWQYSLRQVSGGSYGSLWQLYATGQLSSTASAAVNTFASGYLMGYVETTTLIQRLGELRDTTMQNGVWARVHGGKFNTDGMRHGKEFDLDYGGVQIGYDRKLATAWDGSLYAGIMFGYAKGDIDFDYAGGDGDVKSKTLGVYGTYKQTDGFYVDAVLKYQWIDYDFNTYDSAGTKVTANEPDGGGFGLSLEVGKRFELKNNWFVEPQAQLSYQKQDGGTFYMSNGLRLGVDDWTSLLGRLGVRVGYESGAHSFYAKLSWVKEFDGDFDFTANGIGFRDSFGDNWWVYGIGYVSKINERNSLYLDLERSSGGVFEQDWAVKGGWRVEM